MTAELRI